MVQIVRQTRFSDPQSFANIERIRGQAQARRREERATQLAQQLFGQTPLAEGIAPTAPVPTTPGEAEALGGTPLQQFVPQPPQPDPFATPQFLEFAALDPGGAQAAILGRRQATLNRDDQSKQREFEFQSIVQGSKAGLSIANNPDLTPEQRVTNLNNFLVGRAQEIQARGGNPSDTLEVIQTLNERGLEAATAEMQQAVDLGASFGNTLGPGKIVPNSIRDLEGGGQSLLVQQPDGTIKQVTIGEGGQRTSAAAEKDRKRITDLRKEVSGIQTVKDARKIKGAFNRALKVFQFDEDEARAFLRRASPEGKANLEKLKDNQRAIGDLAIIFNFFKSIDPNSTVREGEFATAENTGGVSDRALTLYRRVLEGARLTDEQRLGFLNQIRGQALGATENALVDTDVQRRVAEKGNLPLDEIFGDLSVPEIPELGLIGQGQQTAPPPIRPQQQTDTALAQGPPGSQQARDIQAITQQQLIDRNQVSDEELERLIEEAQK